MSTSSAQKGGRRAGSEHRRRLTNSLLGLFVGDALSMPVHWYYNLDNLKQDYPNGIRGYEDPKHTHPDAFMVGMEYAPNTAKAEELGRPYDILHEHSRYYQTTYSDFTIELSERDGSHGNAVAAENERYHYHRGLSAGENTLGAELVRVLMRCVTEQGRYDQADFLQRFIDFLTEPGCCRDPYREEYIRGWFENYSEGKDPVRCAVLQSENWSVGSLGGMIRPMVASLLSGSDPYRGIGFAVEHQNLTHRSENVVSALYVVIPLLHDLLAGEPASSTLRRHAARMSLPAITGKRLVGEYRRAGGPGNISDEKMWDLHTRMRKRPWELDQFADEHDPSDVIGGELATACYPEHGVPLTFYLAYDNSADFARTLFANAEAGGDNVHRGMVAGMLVGAAADQIPRELVDGLARSSEIRTEIEKFTELLTQSRSTTTS